MKGVGDALTVYDEVLYPAAVFPQTHPNRLATVAFLRGMQPAPIHRCRVLELGCGVGANIIGMAFQLPTSEFIGLDLAQRPIASGQASVIELDLRNVSLHAMDLCDANPERFGRFDFIIAHGLYSWVPQPVRERILAICREMLNPQGVAYISYNAYPGNHLRDLVRGMMRFHTAGFEDPVDKVGQARGLLKFLAESTPKPDYYVAAIRAQFERTLQCVDEAFFHDDLSEINQPFYFHEFITAAFRHGLQFVGEARANELQPGKFAPNVMERMKELEGAPEVVREQYKDFVRGSAFRETLLCHGELKLAPNILVERVRELYASCDAAPETGGESRAERALFRRASGAELETSHPLIYAAMKSLWSHWPVALSFEALLDHARAQSASGEVGRAGTDELRTLAEALTVAYRAGFLQLQVAPHEVTNVVSQRPSTSRLTRFLLERGDFATNQLHASIKFPDALSRRLVQLLDGTRDQEMLTRDLVEYVRAGHGEVFENGALVENMMEVPAIIERRVREGLQSLAREGMLVS
ncbi:MAG: methyltransferase regulatory domain-containing protein [Verrucomicrobia bacterium]|nr:methyltransferase regulatory domain-containing protein [Verrucomicrobiota bacterium]